MTIKFILFWFVAGWLSMWFLSSKPWKSEEPEPNRQIWHLVEPKRVDSLKWQYMEPVYPIIIDPIVTSNSDSFTRGEWYCPDGSTWVRIEPDSTTRDEWLTRDVKWEGLWHHRILHYGKEYYTK